MGRKHAMSPEDWHGVIQLAAVAGIVVLALRGRWGCAVFLCLCAF